MTKEQLINAVVEQIKKDVNEGDLTAIEGLLQLCSVKMLKDFLPETDVMF